ncbi:preprotein translocase subunit YajC [Nitrosomonas supralitoralis]|uniref:Sec translocon accessory complex subunit YajC n=1 Tax=Nitrosomonas supralitoralis TaxID=2116706 RepID=A0A2P7NUV0_9PROT|nr:preprotein translocase subunit YajC [Nitrosomonas supralitoralis]PSJ17215.1 preprotein translocase subunit YajC [Nitrosomonas supralitoralis]
MLINDAFAQATASTAQSDAGWVTLLPMIGILVLFYFLLIRPQAKRAKEHKQMVEALQRGDEVITNGGILGQILNVSETYVIIEIAPAIEITVLKSSVQTLLPKGTLRSIEPKSKAPRTKTPKSIASESNKAVDANEATEAVIAEADINNEKK